MAIILVVADTTTAARTRPKPRPTEPSGIRPTHPQHCFPTKVPTTYQYPKILWGDKPRTLAQRLLACLPGQWCG